MTNLVAWNLSNDLFETIWTNFVAWNITNGFELNWTDYVVLNWAYDLFKLDGFDCLKFIKWIYFKWNRQIWLLKIYQNNLFEYYLKTWLLEIYQNMIYLKPILTDFIAWNLSNYFESNWTDFTALIRSNNSFESNSIKLAANNLSSNLWVFIVNLKNLDASNLSNDWFKFDKLGYFNLLKRFSWYELVRLCWLEFIKWFI